MKVDGTQTNPTQALRQNTQSDDPVIKNAESQIEALQKQLQQLAKNEDMDADTKREKRQELQQQISDLNAAIRQRQMELRNKKQQENMEKAEAARTKNEPEAVKEAKQAGAFTTRGLNAVLSAGNAMEISKAQGDIATKLEGRANELKSEISRDKSRSADIRQKSNELSKVTRGAKKAKSDQIGTLSKAVRELSDAAEDEEDKKASSQEEDETIVGVLYSKDGKLQTEEQDPEYQARA